MGYNVRTFLKELSLKVDISIISELMRELNIDISSECVSILVLMFVPRMLLFVKR